MRSILYALAIMLALTAPAAADSWDDGLAAYDRGDFVTALRIWRPMAEQGNVDAQYGLGSMYYKGQGVPQDYAEAMRWYRKAAEQGDDWAQYILGLLYYNGQGVPQDYAEAVKWYRKAAEQGLKDAQYNLGSAYGNGQGVPQDYVLAHMWWNLAAAQGNEKAAKNREIAAKRMTPAQLAEAQRLAREWRPKR